MRISEGRVTKLINTWLLMRGVCLFEWRAVCVAGIGSQQHLAVTPSLSSWDGPFLQKPAK